MFQLITALQAWLATRRTDERGATMVEYGLIVVAIALVVFAGATILGNSVKGLFSSIAGTL
jgi:pilus assembly protein Flp/PilA